MKHSIVACLLFWVCNVATAQVMLPTFQGVFNAKTLSADGASNGLHFDGTDDYIDLSNSSSLNFASTQNFTLEAWVKRKTGLGGEIISRYNGGVSGQYTLRIENNGNVYFLREVAPYQLISTTAISENSWHHIAATYDGSYMKIFIDGVLSGSMISGSVSATANSQKILIGARLSSNTVANNFNGTMDDLRIWNVARSQAQIQAAMNYELSGSESGLVAYYTFNQGLASGNNTAISTLINKSANSLNGSLTNFSQTGASSNFVIGKVEKPLIEDGLILSLDANNTTSYSGSGSTWNDISGNNYNCALSGGVSFTSTNGISTFNFASGFGTITLPKTTTMTYSIWAKSSVTCSSPFMVLFSTGSGTGGPQLYFRACVNSWNTGDGGSNAFSNANYSAHGTNWQNYIVVNDGSDNTTKLYYNGVFIGAAINHKYSSANILTIGGTTANPWQGAIANVKAFNKALSNSEILNLYISTKGVFSY